MGSARAVSARAFASICAAVVCAVPAAPALAEWRRLDSPNFVVIGDVSTRTLRDIAVRFEGFRETLSRVLSDRVTATAVPTIVVVFPSDRAFSPFKPTFQGRPVELSGLFIGGRDVNYIALLSDHAVEGMRVVFHEYAHLIISNVARNVPVWLNEGLAEYYSTYEVSSGGREALLGRPVGSHLLRLRETRLLGLDELLAVTRDSPLYNEGERRSVFYAQSWALTHMLLIGEPRREGQLAEYLTRVGQGAAAVEAWRQVFGADPVQRDLRNYVEQIAYNAVQYKFPDKLTSFNADTSVLPPSDTEAFLADFLLQQERGREAADRLAKVPRDDARPWAVTAAALLDAEKGDNASAREKLKTLDPASDWLTAYRAGVTLAAASRDRRDRPDAEAVAAARRLFDVARRNGRVIPNGAARLIELELAANTEPSPEMLTAMEQARLMAPGRPDYVFLHARLLARASLFAAARTALAPLMTPAYTPEIRDYARKLMGYIVRAERTWVSRFGPVAGQSPLDSSAPSPPEPPPDPAAEVERVQPDYRKPGAGEERTEGVLTRIDCKAESVIFSLRTGEGLSAFTAPGMAAVDFVTYRDDLTGTIACGPLKDPARVYITWRSRADQRVAIAIEFLPK
jgi:hypothetical protein